jgi:hypothetical protein
MKLAELLEGKRILEKLEGQQGSLKLEDARRLLTHLGLKFNPVDRVALVIEEAQELTPAAQNMLLKSLEELPDEIGFFLTADQENRLLETVVSRCRVMNLTLTPTLAPEDEAEFSQMFQLVAKRKVGQLLKLAESWSKSDPETKLVALYGFLMDRSRKAPSKARAQAIKCVLECLGDCRGQQNSQLALEELFLSLIKLAPKAQN